MVHNDDTMLDDTNDTSNGFESALATLQPLRDLAKNWDIDVASCLEEYLQEIVGDLPPDARERVANASSGTLNFAQAALVLQNSSNIYSRKVEYLYALVHKALEELSMENGGASNSKNKSGSPQADAALDDFLNFDPHQEFLPLNDVMPTDGTDDCHKINLAEDEQIDPTRSFFSFTSPRRRSLTGLSLGGSNSMGDNSASIGASAAAHHRALVGSLDTESLRLVGGVCDMGEDGLLRMPGTSSAQPINEPSPLNRNLAATPSMYEVDHDFGGGGYDDNDDDDNDHAGVGFELAEDYGESPVVAEPEIQVPQRRVTFADTVEHYLQKPQLPPEEKDDPWALLDPHSLDSHKPRPLRIGKTIRLPPGVSEPPSQCVTGARTRRIRSNAREPSGLNTTTTRSTLVTETYKALAARKRSHDESNESSLYAEAAFERPIVPLNGMAFGNEFAYIAKATAKRKAAERHELRKQQLAVRGSTAVGHSIDNYDDMDDDDNDGPGFAFGGDEDNDDDSGYDGGGGGGDGIALGNTGMVSVNDAFNVHTDDANLDGENGAPTFEELCRAHIQAFSRGADKYASETKLSQRVGQWQDRLLPLLEEEEQRPVFDIHVYGQTVIASMESEIKRLNQKKGGNVTNSRQNVVDFCEVTRNREPYEVCRIFLASLSLCNSGNVKLCGSHENGTSLQLELLRSDIERPMETYLAPSVATEMEHD